MYFLKDLELSRNSNPFWHSGIKGRATPSAFAFANSFVVATPSAALRPVLRKSQNASPHRDALGVA